MLWISAIGMYALAFYWTRSPLAAFVAGAVFAFQPWRLVLLRWPGMVGNEWTPLALLFAHRLMDRGRWRDAAALATFMVIQILESFYQMVPLAVFGLVYGCWLLVRYRSRLRALAPKLVMVGTATIAALVVVAAPYLEARQTWVYLAGRRSLLPLLNGFLPGNVQYRGTVLLLLGAIGLADRMRGRRGDDPRLPLLLGGIVVLAVGVSGVVIPGLGLVRSPGTLLFSLVPGFDLVRLIPLAILAAWLAPALLASYGVVALTERLRPVTARVTGVAITAVALAKPLVPALASRSYGTDPTVTAAPFTVPREFVNLLDDRLPDGAVLDLPVDNEPLMFSRRAHYVLLAAFHRHATATCAGSFPSPLTPEIHALGMRLPDPRAIDALFALGFRSVIFHEDGYASPARAREAAGRLTGGLPGRPRLVEVGAAQGHRRYRLETTTPVTRDLVPLVGGAVLVGPLSGRPVTPPSGLVTFRLANPGPSTYRHPDPIAPTPLLVRWYDKGNTVIAEHHATMILPLALAAGEMITRDVKMSIPELPGVYVVTAAPVATPASVVAIASVEVRAAGPTGQPGFQQRGPARPSQRADQ